MKNIFLFLLFSLCIYQVQAQCESIALADSSFEDGTFPIGNPLEEPWIWNQTDGANISTSDSYSGFYSVCSMGGGVQQLVILNANTTYHFSCFVKNGQSDFVGPRFIINDFTYPYISVDSDDWTYISQSFNSGSDTIIDVGVESMNCCFDDFSLSCNVLTGIDKLNLDPFNVRPTISSADFTIESKQGSIIEVINVNGWTIETKQMNANKITIGIDLIPGIYILRIRNDAKVAIQRIVKL